MEFPYTVESQDAFDELVKDRIGRERAKFADYDDLKARAEAADTAVADATARAEAAEGKVSAFESEKQVAAWRSEVAKTSGVPESALRGSTKEEFEAHASELKPLLTASRAPVIPTQGDEPPKPQASEEREFVRSLFGGDGD